MSSTTRAEADAAAGRVRRVHGALGLDRPEWLLWVHCGAVDSWLDAHRRSGAPMTDAEILDAIKSLAVAHANLQTADAVPFTLADVITWEARA